MYSETNGLAIHIIIVYFFVVWWSLLHKKNMLIEKSCLLVLIILTFSRAALISIPLGWLYMYCIGRMSKKIQIFLFFLVLVITIAVMPTLISNLESDPSTAMKLSLARHEFYKATVGHDATHGAFINLAHLGHRAPLSMGFSRQEYWSGLPLPSPI